MQASKALGEWGSDENKTEIDWKLFALSFLVSARQYSRALHSTQHTQTDMKKTYREEIVSCLA